MEVGGGWGWPRELESCYRHARNAERQGEDVPGSRGTNAARCRQLGMREKDLQPRNDGDRLATASGAFRYRSPSAAISRSLDEEEVAFFPTLRP